MIQLMLCVWSVTAAVTMVQLDLCMLIHSVGTRVDWRKCFIEF